MSLLNYPTAPLWRRLVAMVYDLLCILAIALLLAVPLNILASFALNDGEPLGALPFAVSASYFFTVIFFFYTTFWRAKGQTLGMKSWGLHVANELKEGQPLSLGQCMLRIAIGFFSLLIAGLGLWWMLWDKQEKTWHDHASFSRIVYIPK